MTDPSFVILFALFVAYTFFVCAALAVRSFVASEGSKGWDHNPPPAPHYLSAVRAAVL
jgi:hypothetical protein